MSVASVGASSHKLDGVVVYSLSLFKHPSTKVAKFAYYFGCAIRYIRHQVSVHRPGSAFFVVTISRDIANLVPFFLHAARGAVEFNVVSVLTTPKGVHAQLAAASSRRDARLMLKLNDGLRGWQYLPNVLRTLPLFYESATLCPDTGSLLPPVVIVADLHDNAVYQCECIADALTRLPLISTSGSLPGTPAIASPSGSRQPVSSHPLRVMSLQKSGSAPPEGAYRCGGVVTWWASCWPPEECFSEPLPVKSRVNGTTHVHTDLGLIVGVDFGAALRVTPASFLRHVGTTLRGVEALPSYGVDEMMVDTFWHSAARGAIVHDRTLCRSLTAPISNSPSVSSPSFALAASNDRWCWVCAAGAGGDTTAPLSGSGTSGDAEHCSLATCTRCSAGAHPAVGVYVSTPDPPPGTSTAQASNSHMHVARWGWAVGSGCEPRCLATAVPAKRSASRVGGRGKASRGWSAKGHAAGVEEDGHAVAASGSGVSISESAGGKASVVDTVSTLSDAAEWRAVLAAVAAADLAEERAAQPSRPTAALTKSRGGRGSMQKRGRDSIGSVSPTASPSHCPLPIASPVSKRAPASSQGSSSVPSGGPSTDGGVLHCSLAEPCGGVALADVAACIEHKRHRIDEDQSAQVSGGGAGEVRCLLCDGVVVPVAPSVGEVVCGKSVRRNGKPAAVVDNDDESVSGGDLRTFVVMSGPSWQPPAAVQGLFCCECIVMCENIPPCVVQPVPMHPAWREPLRTCGAPPSVPVSPDCVKPSAGADSTDHGRAAVAWAQATEDRPLWPTPLQLSAPQAFAREDSDGVASRTPRCWEVVVTVPPVAAAAERSITIGACRELQRG